MKKLLLMALAVMMSTNVMAQRTMDKLDRGLVAVPGRNGGNHVSWRKFGEEYYDTEYNLFRNGTKIANSISTSNYEDPDGNSNSVYSVEAIVNGVAGQPSAEVKAWDTQYFDVKVQPVVNREGKTIANGSGDNQEGYILNDISLADVDGDGVVEFIVKRNNNTGIIRATDNKTDFNLLECYKLDGTRLWWIDLGPNLMAGPDEQWDMIGYDWDGDGKAEMIMRGADNMIIHTASGRSINIGNMDYYAPRDEYTHQGAEYLLYLNGATGEPYGWDANSDSYTPMTYPLPRFEEGEAENILNATDAEYAAVWGDKDTGHRSCKHYFGAPYLDGRKPSIFLGRGCYTRHKFCALDVNAATHELTLRWRWNCYDSASPWFGNGFHNFAIADVDMDGRDEIVFGSMTIDDTGFGLATTGLGHGDAQHCGDLDPYRWGLEQFTCQEGSQGNSYWNATTGQIYYRKADGGDDGRALAGNFTNLYPGCVGRSVSSELLSLSSDRINTNLSTGSSNANALYWSNLNNRIYWTGDLCDEVLNSPGNEREAAIWSYENGRLFTSSGCKMNNSSKNNPSAQGDILGDWREEVVVRTTTNDALRIYTTDYPSNYGIYTLWHDHVYRNGMAWQSVGYNQPPHVSFFLGEMEDITIAPPPVTMTGRKEVSNGGTIATCTDHLLLCEQNDMTVNVTEGANPYIVTVNAPSWVKGSGGTLSDGVITATKDTPKQPEREVIYYTHTLTGGAFSGNTRLVKQGEGRLVLPNVVEKHTGNTDVWNGTLVFDGTFESSPLWLNRHTTLISDGGKFMGGMKVDYNATIYPGGETKTGSITTTSLQLGIGARIVFDVNETICDQMNAESITIETKDWGEYGPTYKCPVFQFNVNGNLKEGRYLLGTIGNITGNLKDILIEGGNSGMRQSLEYEAGNKQLYFVVEALHAPAVITWNGTDDNNIWDYAMTENFLNEGKATYSVKGDEVIFDDNAASTSVIMKEVVYPAKVTFQNDTKDYIFSSDKTSNGYIANEAQIIKNGAGTVTFYTENKTGATIINNGKLIVSQLANNTGQTYGSLGDANQTITINNDATLAVKNTIITDQLVNVDGKANIEVPANTALTFNQGFKGTNAVVFKKGTGTMTLGANNTFSKLVIEKGRVNAVQRSNIDQLPDIVEFHDGVLWGTTDDSNSRTTRTNFVVPEDMNGTYYGSYRGANYGTLTGKGTFTVYSGGVRCYWNGDWSNFEGTVVPATVNRQAKPTYTPTFNFTNSYGLPKASLLLNSDVIFYTNDPQTASKVYNISIGNLLGTGTLSTSASVTIGGLDKDIKFRGSFENSPKITKIGSGSWEITKTMSGIGSLNFKGGDIVLNNTSSKTSLFGTVTPIIQDSACLKGIGTVGSLRLQEGAVLQPGSCTASRRYGAITATGYIYMDEGTKLNLIIYSNIGNQYSRSYIVVNGELKLNGELNIELGEEFVPSLGDSFTLWTAGSITGTPSAINLPMLPDGLYWDTSELLTNNGTLKVTDTPTGINDAIKYIEQNDIWYNLDGQRIGGKPSNKGIYIKNGKKIVIK